MMSEKNQMFSSLKNEQQNLISEKDRMLETLLTEKT